MVRNKRCCVTLDEDDESLLVISFFYWDQNIDPQVFHFRRPRTEQCEKTLFRMVKTMEKLASANLERRRKEEFRRQRDIVRRSKTPQGTESAESDEDMNGDKNGAGDNLDKTDDVDPINKKDVRFSGAAQEHAAGDHRENTLSTSRPTFDAASKIQSSTTARVEQKSGKEKTSRSEHTSVRILRAADQQAVSLTRQTNEQVFTPQNLLAVGDSFVYSIQLNVPYCASITVPQHVMIGFRNYAGVELENCSRETSRIFWMIPMRYDKHPDDIVIPEQLDADFVARVRQETGLADEEIRHWGEELYNAFYFEQWQICGREQSYQPGALDFGVPLKVLCVPINAEGVSGAPKFIVGRGGSIGGDSGNNSESFSIEWGPNCCLPFTTRSFRSLNSRDSVVGDNKIRVVSYNMLFDLKPDADFSRGDQQYPNCARRVLEIGYRMQLIRRELATYAADIFMLQECTYFMFLGHLKPFLIDELGYEGHLSLRRKRVSQSVVSFYKKERFHLIDSYDFHINNLMPPSSASQSRKIHRSETVFEGVAQRSLENVDRFPQCKANHYFILQMQEHFNAVGMPSQQASKSESRDDVSAYGDHLIDSINNLAHVMQVFVLRDKTADAARHTHLIFTCNTHLYWHPNYPAYRLIQMQLILNKLEQIVQKNCDSAGAQTTFSVILCGDMNSSEERGIHEFLTTGSLPAEFPEWSEQTIMTDPSKLSDAADLTDAAHTSGRTRENSDKKSSESDQVEDDSDFRGVRVPELFGKFETFPVDSYAFTHYIDQYHGRLDWIYYTNGKIEKENAAGTLRMCNVLSMPDEDLLREWLPLPNTVFPSDHIAVGVDFTTTRGIE